MQRGGFVVYQWDTIELHSEFIGLEIHDFGGTAFAIEFDVVVRLRGEDEIGHGDATAVNKDLDAALVDKDVEMIGLTNENRCAWDWYACRRVPWCLYNKTQVVTFT